jgi:predicted Ser/Thr protein kinase
MPPQTLDPGTVIGGYVVERLLGHGGMGNVYLATDLALGRPVALKVLPEDAAADPERRRRLRDEGRLLQTLRHPNLCQVYEVGEADGFSFIAMEFVQGHTLQDVAAGGRVPVRRVVAIARALAGALEAARSARIVHRDLKGSNVMVQADGELKILDFGLARFADSPAATLRPVPRQTEPGLVLGTAEFMSPEQALGRSLDHRSDLFSLGVLLYDLLAGRLPFAGRTKMQLFWAIVNGAPASLRRLNPAVTDSLERIVLKLLEKDVRHRYQTAGQLLADLDRLGSEPDDLAAARREALGCWTGRLAGSALGILTAWAMMPVAFAVSSLADHAIDQNPFLPASVWAGTASLHDLAAVINPATNPLAAWISNDGRVVFSTRRRNGRGDLFVASPGGRLDHIAAQADEAAVGPLGRHVYFTRMGASPGLFKVPMSGEPVMQLAAGRVARPVVSADGATVYFARLGGSGYSMWSIPARGGASPVQLSTFTSGTAPLLSPQLTRLAIQEPGGVRVCDMPACTNAVILPIVSLVGWTPDGRALTHTGAPASSNIWITSIHDGSIRQVTRFTDQMVTSISWSPNGQRIAVTRQRTLADLVLFTAMR